MSISTLRRKIKAKDIRFRLDQGKYFILDEELQRPSLGSVTHSVEEHRPSLNVNTQVSAQNLIEPEPVVPTFNETPLMTQPLSGPMNGEPVLTAANKLLSELKKAYSLILQEKEEMILNLKEEVSDLKTLVRVLESENERIKGRSNY